MQDGVSLAPMLDSTALSPEGEQLFALDLTGGAGAAIQCAVGRPLNHLSTP